MTPSWPVHLSEGATSPGQCLSEPGFIPSLETLQISLLFELQADAAAETISQLRSQLTDALADAEQKGSETDDVVAGLRKDLMVIG